MQAARAPSRQSQRKRQRPIGQSGRDRKSTRLNSSHVKTSYAVFCLKKKKALGDLWQDYNSFCESPNACGNEYLMCRRFRCAAKVLRGGAWVVQVTVTTATVDGRSVE